MLTKPTADAPRAQVEDYILARCLADRSVMDAAIRNPRFAMHTELGFTFPPPIQIQLLVDDAATCHLVVPYELPMGDELPDELLEMVAGGCNAGTTNCDPNDCKCNGGC